MDFRFIDDTIISKVEEAEGLVFPVIVKPRDNSGSRGVKLCCNQEELKESLDEALENSKLDTVLVEEFIEGSEYSIESLHHDGKSEVIQFTEKKTTEFPYNVELGHIQPANISDENKQKICEIISPVPPLKRKAGKKYGRTENYIRRRCSKDYRIPLLR